MRRRFLLLLCTLATVLLTGAPAHRAVAAPAPVRVVTTTTMVTDLVKEIGGDRVDVAGLMGPGVDPHLYKPTASDVTRLQKAQLVFYSGLHLEGQMAQLFERLAKSGRKIFAITASIPQEQLLRPAQFEGQFDPHVWGDAKLWAQCIDTVVNGLSGADAEGQVHFTKRAAAYRATLEALHAWATKRAAELPVAQRILITSHDAFNYFGRAYGFQVVAVQGISTVTEAGLADIVKVIDFIKQKSVKAVFVESSVPKAAIERISKDSGAKIGGELFSDALGTAGKIHTVEGESYDEGTVVGMLKFN